MMAPSAASMLSASANEGAAAAAAGDVLEEGAAIDSAGSAGTAAAAAGDVLEEGAAIDSTGPAGAAAAAELADVAAFDVRCGNIPSMTAVLQSASRPCSMNSGGHSSVEDDTAAAYSASKAADICTCNSSVSASCRLPKSLLPPSESSRSCFLFPAPSKA
jgi:hypothetical protein